ncbi:MAG TPA: IgA Peptidase M64 [Thermoanaerobaculia bacterium]|nr:IgA Peptidase M64 [Thermoanaerobaculia bacterium]
MKKTSLPVLLTLLVPVWAAAAAPSPSPALSAIPRTMRLDYYHTGSATEERFSLDRVVLEPLPWPGNPARPLDDTNLGKYFFEVIDRGTNRVLYSRGFAAVFGEWQETDEAKEASRTFSESLRFPAPDRPVRIVLQERDARNDFHPVWTTVVDPASPFVDSSRPPSPGPLLALQKSGDPATKVDFLILGDGYAPAERGKFEKDARRLVEILFATSPFKEHRSDFNVWGLCPEAPESGISRPSTGVHHRSPVGAAYDTFGSERYVLTFENRAFRDVAAFAPYEFVEILVNGQTYGGGGIFNLYSTVAADSEWAPYVFVHEFGHHFAGLADEYYTSDVATAGQPVEPWEANVTTVADAGKIKWKELLTPGTPVPTPWKKDEFETYEKDVQKRRRAIRAANRPEAEMDALFREERGRATQLLNQDQHSGQVGAFEGASYHAKGFYRPTEDCIMFTRDEVGFCPVCRRTLEQVIALYTAR